jgi:hypothetical protein
MNITGVVFLMLVSMQWQEPQLLRFTYSECQSDSHSMPHSQIKMVEQHGDTLQVSIATYANCGGIFQGGVAYQADSVLDLQLKRKPTVYVWPNGEKEELIIGCDCFYEFHFQILGIQQKAITAYLVDGLTLEEIDQRSIITFEEPPRVFSPQFPGGDSLLKAWVEQHMKVPSCAKKQTSSKKIEVKLHFSSSGKLETTSILASKRQCRKCYKEVERLLSLLPSQWQPGSYEDKQTGTIEYFSMNKFISFDFGSRTVHIE